MEMMQTIIEDIKRSWGEQAEILEDKFFDAVKVPANILPELFIKLRDEHGFNYLSNLTAVDYPERFELVYHIYSLNDSRKLLVKADVDHSEPSAPSVVSVWPTADWQEREVYDLMGITFTGHPNLKRVLLPDEFEGHPLRKDFVMKGWTNAAD